MAAIYWRGVRVCSCMSAPLNEAARLVTVRAKAAGVPDWTLTPIQGSYSTSTSASAGTHDGGGAIDISMRGLSTKQKSILDYCLREVGYPGWPRETSWWSDWFRKIINGGWSPHWHGVLYGCPHLSSAAKAQIGEYLRGENGLVGGDRDTGTRSFVGRTWQAYLDLKNAVVNIGGSVVASALSRITPNIPVGLTAPIHMANLHAGKRGPEVARYQAALWNRLPGAVRTEFVRKYSLKRTDLYDGIYGPVTAAITARLYVLIRLPSATEPGPKLMRHLGFLSVR